MITLLAKALRELESDSTSTGKINIIEKYSEMVPEFKEMLLLALDPYRKFNIQKLPGATARGRIVGEWKAITDHCYGILSGEIRGKSILQRTVELQSNLSMNGAMILRRIMLKDLRCGVGAALVNKVLPGFIPTFGVALAEPLEERHCKKLFNHIHEQLVPGRLKKVFVQPKLNGDRMVVIVQPDGQVDCLSRKGHPMLNYQMIAKNLRTVMEFSDFKDIGLVFDGEVINKDFFTTRKTKKLAGNEVEDAVFYVFDMITLTQWRRQRTSSFSSRKHKLAQLANGSTFGMFQNLKLVETKVVPPNMLVMPKLDSIRDQYMRQGYEGAMFRFDEPYNFKTKSSILKHKKMDTIDLMIVRVEPGEEGKKHADTAGKLVIDMGDGTECKAGLRLSDKERDELWERRNELAGMIAEISYQEKTVNESGIPKLQFPVFVRVREDKS